MQKKAQGMTLHTIVIAAIVLVILIVLISIFTGYFGKFLPGFIAASERECTGDFSKAYRQCPDGTTQVFGNFKGTLDPEEVCCKKAAEEKSNGNEDVDVCQREGGDCVDSCPEDNDNKEGSSNANEYCVDQGRGDVCCIFIGID